MGSGDQVPRPASRLPAGEATDSFRANRKGPHSDSRHLFSTALRRASKGSVASAGGRRGTLIIAQLASASSGPSARLQGWAVLRGFRAISAPGHSGALARAQFVGRVEFLFFAQALEKARFQMPAAQVAVEVEQVHLDQEFQAVHGRMGADVDDAGRLGAGRFRAVAELTLTANTPRSAGLCGKSRLAVGKPSSRPRRAGIGTASLSPMDWARRARLRSGDRRNFGAAPHAHTNFFAAGRQFSGQVVEDLGVELEHRSLAEILAECDGGFGTA